MSCLCVLGVLCVHSALASGSPVRAVPERTEEQRHMVMLLGVAHVERNLRLREEGYRETLIAMIRRDVEREPIGSRHQRETFGQRGEAPVLVGDAASDGRPLALLPNLENHGDAAGRRPKSQIQDVCGDHFFGAAGPHPRRLPPRASRRSALVSSPLLLGARPTSFLSALGAGQQPFAAWGASHLAPLGARRWSAALCCLGRVPPRSSRRSALVSSPLLLGARPTSFLSALGAGQQPFAAWGASHLVPLGARRWSAALCCLGRVPPRASRRSALVSSPLLLGARPTSFLSALGAGQQPFAAWGASHLAPLGARRWSAALCCLGRVPPRSSRRSALVSSPLLLGARPTSFLSALGAGQQPFAAWGASHLAPLGARRWSAALCCLGRVPPRSSRRSALVSSPLLLGARPTSFLSALGAGQQPF